MWVGAVGILAVFARRKRRADDVADGLHSNGIARTVEMNGPYRRARRRWRPRAQRFANDILNSANAVVVIIVVTQCGEARVMNFDIYE